MFKYSCWLDSFFQRREKVTDLTLVELATQSHKDTGGRLGWRLLNECTDRDFYTYNT